MSVRVRFAPSPAGYLHVGGARTALFNWLWARKHGGSFVLRIEDTDRPRSMDPNTRSILEGLEWLGLRWDEGPYLQSAGLRRHRETAYRLLSTGNAYRSFATPEELDLQRKQAAKDGKPWLRDRPSRELSRVYSERRAAAGQPYAIRFKVPEDDGATRFDDMVYGSQAMKHLELEDFALLRPDGSPLQDHVIACDDVEMRISDVLRGEDHLSNTHRQLLIYEALGVPPPRFAHLPLINAPDGTRLSRRRHGEVACITAYRERGFLPEAVRNFLALLGWSAGGGREIYSMEELIQGFSLESISRANAILSFSETDPRQWTDRKALSINQQYIAGMPLADLLPGVEDVLRMAGMWDQAYARGGPRRDWFERTVDLVRGRFRTLLDFAEEGRAYFLDTFELDADSVEKDLRHEPRLQQWLPGLAALFQALERFETETAEAALRAYAEEQGADEGVLISSVRAAVTGRSDGPSLFEILECLGRERVVRRLEAAAALL